MICDSYSWPVKSREEAEANVRVISQIAYIARMFDGDEEGALCFEKISGMSQKMLRSVLSHGLQSCRRYLSVEDMRRIRDKAENETLGELLCVHEADLEAQAENSNSEK